MIAVALLAAGSAKAANTTHVVAFAEPDAGFIFAYRRALTAGPSQPTIDDLQRVAYPVRRTSLATTPTNRSRIEVADPYTSPVTTLVAEGDSAPGMSTDVVFGGFDSVHVTSDGTIGFEADLAGPGVSSSPDSEDSYWLKLGAAAPQLLIRRGAPLPGRNPNEIVDHYLRPELAQDGVAVIQARVNGMDGIWQYDPIREFRLVAQDGMPAPGLPPGTTFDQTWNDPVVNSLGRVAFGSGLAGGTVTSQDDRAIWTNRSGDLELIVREGEIAPGTNSRFGSVLRNNNLAFNSSGAIAFATTAGRKGGIWLDDGSGGLSLVAISDGAATSVGANASFTATGTPLLSEQGDLVFDAYYRLNNSSPVQQGIFRKSGVAEPQLEVNLTDGLPGWNALSIQELDQYSQQLMGPVLNDLGRMAFGVQRQKQNTPNVDYGIWVQDRAGRLRLAAQTGDEIDVNPGPGTDLRTLSSIAPWHVDDGPVGLASGGDDGRPISFNNRGEVSFTVRFTDGSSAVIVSSIGAIPEPGSALLAVLASATLAVTCRGRRPHRGRRRRWQF
ncbi:MAG: hypothetical protein KDA44_08450 [Planctomycetales bacterium]|nr:hypothetical protein [Planctomycetales bacterium]